MKTEEDSSNGKTSQGKRPPRPYPVEERGAILDCFLWTKLCSRLTATH